MFFCSLKVEWDEARMRQSLTTKQRNKMSLKKRNLFHVLNIWAKSELDNFLFNCFIWWYQVSFSLIVKPNKVTLLSLCKAVLLPKNNYCILSKFILSLLETNLCQLFFQFLFIQSFINIKNKQWPQNGSLRYTMFYFS